MEQSGPCLDHVAWPYQLDLQCISPVHRSRAERTLLDAFQIWQTARLPEGLFGLAHQAADLLRHGARLPNQPGLLKRRGRQCPRLSNSVRGRCTSRPFANYCPYETSCMTSSSGLRELLSPVLSLAGSI